MTRLSHHSGSRSSRHPDLNRPRASARRRSAIVGQRRAQASTTGTARDPRGRRFTPDEKAEALRLIVGGMKREAVAKHVGTSTQSLRRWYKAAEAAGSLPRPPEHGPTAATKSTVSDDTTQPSTKAQSTSAPKDPGAGLGEHEVAAI